MNKNFFVRSIFCIAIFGLTLYFYLNRQTQLTKVQIAIPQVAKQIKMLKEENTRLLYQIQQFESPNHLLELARKSEFSHLKYPLMYEIMTVSEGMALQIKPEESAPATVQVRPKITFAVGSLPNATQ